ncbi:MAG: hypothetical protein HA496_07060 [Thaumarchaeota archaeon]|nr:hypothetical protein [Nitrososphaerota archaeon]
MNEILEEHLKDALWITLTLTVSFTLLRAANTVITVFSTKVFNSILFLIGKYADLSAEYGGEFTISMPGNSYLIIQSCLRIMSILL